MSTLAHRPNTALLVIDVQNGVVAQAHDRDAIVARIAGLVDRARGAGIPVVWIQHSDAELPEGSQAWQIVAELSPTDTEPLIGKNYGDSFEGTTLEATLAGLGIGHLVVAGAQTDQCIRSTIHGGFVRGYDVTLVADAHTTEDLSEWGAPPPEQVIAHTNLYWSHQAAPGRTAQSTLAGDIGW
ncbi:cysteine hydrolase family protein [Mycolicibacterium rhodesiae]|uniref:Cysteine hydrolase n=1 Tax=Mycolicibacterium rhodesiae TaxID=36814 RepID=A0A1X0IWR3_MYCRH|nr:cysteine hydrolase family protein [Mycolicibacterium rhodesiae]MCV7343152.1 cysteine hydrolase [Mycolicibacterium rhodesiae]ORB53061.1 cysteine hydrolase [Mycolicibacterium rhodesiae]